MSLFAELRRRNVFRVGAAYVVGAWLLIQVAETIFPLFGFGDTPARIVVVVLAIGLLPVLVTAWLYEITPEGLKFDRDADRARTLAPQTGKKLDRAIIIVLALALSLFAVDEFVLEPARDAKRLQKATDAAVERAIAEAKSALPERSIAVLPFSDLSADGNQTYISDGIAEELLHMLAKFSDLRVVSRSSSFVFRDNDTTMPEVSERLHVRYLLAGSIRRAGDQVRITAQLIDGHSDELVWSEIYARRMDDIFAIEDDISAQVMQQLEVELMGTPVSAQVTDVAVYEIYLKGRFELSQLGGEHIQKAEELFQQAIDLDPSYGPAHAGLALALVRRVLHYSDIAPEIGFPRAEAAIKHALELNPDDADALIAKGLLVEESDPEAARRLFEQVIASNPSNSDAYRWLAWTYGTTTQPLKYLDYMRRAYLSDPMVPSMNRNYALALLRFGRHDEALSVARSWRDRFPASPLPYVMASQIHQNAGRIDKALRAKYRAYQLGPKPAATQIAWLMFDWLREDELAETWMDESLRNDPDDGAAMFLQIVMPMVRGDRQQSLERLAETEEQHPDWWLPLGRIYVVVARDFERALEVLDRGRRGTDDSVSEVWEPEEIADYALALQRTGAQDRAERLVRAAQARVGSQIDGGFVVSIDGVTNFHFYAAALHALRGDYPQMMAALRHDSKMGSVSCFGCLFGWPHFDAYRNEPEFIAFLGNQTARIDAIRQQLRSEGMLLTPEAVRGTELSREDVFTL